MAIQTNEDARDYILAKFKTAWDANAAAVNGGTVPEVEWPNIPTSRPLSEGNEPWARIVVKHTLGSQRSLGEKPNRRFQRDGIVLVQVFVPAAKRGLVTGDRLGNVALDAFEGEESGDVWFRDAVLAEIGVDGNWYQFNVTATFEYDVVK
jgi:hypothetical protein